MRTGIEPLELPEIPLQPHQPLSAGTDAGALRYTEVLGSAKDFVVALLVQLEEDAAPVAAVYDAETAPLRLSGHSDKRAGTIFQKTQPIDTLHV